jgi:hypothetical protein
MKDSMVDMDKEGNEIKFFASKFLVRKYLKLSDADLDLNEKLKKEEQEDNNLAGNTGENEEDAGGFGESLMPNIDYDKLSSMIVEKMTNKRILTEADEEKNNKTKKDKGKKKTPCKCEENDDDKEEE